MAKFVFELDEEATSPAQTPPVAVQLKLRRAGNRVQFYARNPANGGEWIYATVHESGKVEVYTDHQFKETTNLDRVAGMN